MAHPPVRIVSDAARELTATIRREVRARLGPDSTFEQRRDAAAALTGDALWLDTDQDLQEAITTKEKIEIGCYSYCKLEQDSSATYYGRWGSHYVEEPLYRCTGRSACTMDPRSSRSNFASGSSSM